MSDLRTAYSLVLNERLPPAYQLLEIFPTRPGLIWTLHPPCLLIFANFNFSTCKMFKYTLSIKVILTNLCARGKFS